MTITSVVIIRGCVLSFRLTTAIVLELEFLADETLCDVELFWSVLVLDGTLMLVWFWDLDHSTSKTFARRTENVGMPEREASL